MDSPSFASHTLPRRSDVGTAGGGAQTRAARSQLASRVVHVRPLPWWLLAVGLLGGCSRGPQLCIFDGTSIGVTALPMVALHPDGSLDTESRYNWQEFSWPTDPQLVTVEHVSSGWEFHGTTAGKPWTFRGGFADAGGAFVRTGQEGLAPPIEVDGRAGKPFLLRYRVKPCREFQGSQTGARTCLQWGRELNARTKLQCP